MSSAAPVVALVAPGGMMGTAMAPKFAEAVKKGEFASLVFVSKKETEQLKKLADSGEGKVKLAIAEYEDRTSLEKAFEGVTVVVSVISAFAPPNVKENIIQAAKSQGVKVYMPSEFGYDYDSIAAGSPMFNAKLTHRKAAEAAGLKVVAIAIGIVLESIRSPLWDTHTDEWSLPGDGTTQFALTSLPNIADYTVRAAILSVQDPSSVPERVRVYSVTKTWNEYADETEKIKGSKIKRKFVSQEELDSIMASGKAPQGGLFILRKLAMGPTTDFVGRNHNELLNAGGKFFKVDTYEDSFGRELKY